MTTYDGVELPERYPMPEDDERTELRNGVVRALYAIPMHFTSTINIEGLDATDLFSVNTLLGGAIETQTVAILNSMRSIWDPFGKWTDKEFRRYPESFPDVRLVGSGNDANPLIGIELKGWYILSKEAEPSLRYKASADAMTPWDILCCVPWGLSNVLSGEPVAYSPYIEQAKYAADMRTYYWNHRAGDNPNRDCTINHPICEPYPKPGSAYIDVPAQDGGGNFGRIARVPGLMKEWVTDTLSIKLAGIEAGYWVSFLSLFKEGTPKEEIKRGIKNIAKAVEKTKVESQEDLLRAEEIICHLEALVSIE